MSNFVVTSLPAYVQENHDLLVRRVVLGGDFISRIHKQTGIKKDAYINLLNIATPLQDGAVCGFNASGDMTLSQRTINTAMIKVNLNVCPETLRGKYAEYLLSSNANADDLPFEQYIMDDVVNQIKVKIEKLVWQGDTSGSGDLSFINGLLKTAGADSSVVSESIASGSSAYAGIAQVYGALTEEALEKGAEIYVSPAIYRVFMQEMVKKNYFHYSGAVNAAPSEFILAGTDVKVVKCGGLAGSLKIVGTYPENIYFGCDLESDAEKIKVWFSDDGDVYKIAVKWNCGINYAFPQDIVLGTFAAAPTMPTF